MEERKASCLEEVIDNFELHGLAAESPFYVNVDEARNADTAQGTPSVRQQIVHKLKQYSRRNRGDIDEFQFCRLLFVGHRGCGKTTELHRVQKAVESQYETIYVSNIEQQEGRLTTQADFIYFIMEEVVGFCKKHPDYAQVAEKEINALFLHLKDTIFGTVSKRIQIQDNAVLGLEANASTEVGVWNIFKLFGRIRSKATFTTEQTKVFNSTIQYYIRDFIQISNQILMKMQSKARENNKMLLLILDGIDKVREDVANNIFLAPESFLPLLKCSMIVTFPLYLNYSPEYNRAVSPFTDPPYILSMIPVRKVNGEPYEDGIKALTDVIEARMDVNALIESRDVLRTAILTSGGNVRDLFTFIRKSAENADILGYEKVREHDLQGRYREKWNELERQLNKSYVPMLDQIFNDTRKCAILSQTQEDKTLLHLFDAGLVMEYNGKRWVDLHPLLKTHIEGWMTDGSWSTWLAEYQRGN